MSGPTVKINRSVVVITPTTGDPKLADAIYSVAKQTYPEIKHLIVVDGDQYTPILRKNHILRIGDFKNVSVVQLKDNTGGNGFYGHRIFAGFPHLVNEDYVFFLDQDNWYEPNHVEELVKVLDEGNDFAYSLRTIWKDNSFNFLCKDDCESLGKWPVWTDPNSYLIDTSAYAFNRLFLIQVCHLWHWGYAGDRRFFSFVRGIPNIKYDTSGKYTLNYRLGSSETSPSPDFFIQGNENMRNRYGILRQEFPWKR